jgi:preprotein translocase subunit SecA
MDELKQSVQLAVHEQKDPLLIYKFEAFELFKEMIEKVNKEIVSFLFKGELPSGNSNEIQEAGTVKRSRENLQTSKEEIPNSDELAARNRAVGQNQGQRPQVTETITREQPKIGRNERVTIKNIMSGESKTVKFKQAEPLISKGEWVIIQD